LENVVESDTEQVIIEQAQALCMLVR